MAYIGYNPSQLAIAPFATKYFTGDGATTTFTLDQSVPGANEANVEVFVENVQQNPVDAYTIGGALNNQLIFSEAPVTGGAIYVIHKGEATYNLQPATGSVTANTLDPVLRNFTVDKFTGTGAQTAFTLTDTPYSPNSILVSIDGIVQQAGTNYTLSGTTLTFAAEAPDVGSDITVIHMGFSSGNKAVMDASITPVKLSTGGPSWETTGRLSITGPTVGSLRISNTTADATNKLGRITGRAYDNSQSDFLALDIRGLNGQNQLWYGGGSDLLTCVSEHRWSIAANTTTTGGTQAMLLDVNGFLAIGSATGSAINTNYIGGNTNAKNLSIVGNGAAASADGRLILVNPQAYSSISTTTSTAGRIYFGFPNVSGGTTGNFAAIDTLAYGAGGAGGYGITMRLQPKSDNGAAIVAMQLLPTGTVDLPYGQIKFPAVQNASSDANTLDDYEEGTWTPNVYHSGSNNSTWSVREGRYTKIGRVVYFYFNLDGGNSGTAGSAMIFTLPMAFATNVNWTQAGTVNASSGNYGAILAGTSASLGQIWTGGGSISTQITFITVSGSYIAA
jgi:hypothetical protein